MPAKFEARIRQPHTEDIMAYIEARNQHDAEALFAQQFGRDNIRVVTEIPYSNTDGHSSPDGLSDGFSDDRQMLGPLIALGVAAWLAYQGYTAFIKPAFSTADEVSTAAATSTPETSAPVYASDDITSSTDSLPTVDPTSDVTEQSENVPSNEITQNFRDDSVAAPAATISADRPQLVNFDIMVSVDGSYKHITVSAKDESDARRIVRDFRGNPEIIEVSPHVTGNER